MKTIRDPVHGDIELSDAELAIVDSEEFQRLRRIKQLSFCSLVYPGANHTRFEHSLGTMQLAGRMARRLGLDEGPIRMAGLVHDLGHLPFSHCLEDVFGFKHEGNLKLVLKGCVGDRISEAGFDKKKILDLVMGKGAGKIISSQIDADRMDYLLRDSHYTGVAYGVIDADRIINVMGLESSVLFFRKKGLIALESLLIGRNQMYAAVYFHHTVRVADVMLQEAMVQIKDELGLEELLRMGDEELKIFAKNKSLVAKELLDLLDKRQLYKVVYSGPKTVDRGQLIKKTGLKTHQLLVSRVSLGRSLAFNIPIEDGGEIRQMTQVSKTAKNLEAEIKQLEETEICTPPLFKDKVSKLLE